MSYISLQYNPEVWADDPFYLSRIAAARSAAYPHGDVPQVAELYECTPKGLKKVPEPKLSAVRAAEVEAARDDKRISSAAESVLQRHGFKPKEEVKRSRTDVYRETGQRVAKKTWREALLGSSTVKKAYETPRRLWDKHVEHKTEVVLVEQPITTLLSESATRRLERRLQPVASPAPAQTFSSQAFGPLSYESPRPTGR
jgi:hypothetical protein